MTDKSPPEIPPRRQVTTKQSLKPPPTKPPPPKPTNKTKIATFSKHLSVPDARATQTRTRASTLSDYGTAPKIPTENFNSVIVPRETISKKSPIKKHKSSPMKKDKGKEKLSDNEKETHKKEIEKNNETDKKKRKKPLTRPSSFPSADIPTIQRLDASGERHLIEDAEQSILQSIEINQSFHTPRIHTPSPKGQKMTDAKLEKILETLENLRNEVPIYLEFMKLADKSQTGLTSTNETQKQIAGAIERISKFHNYDLSIGLVHVSKILNDTSELKRVTLNGKFDQDHLMSKLNFDAHNREIQNFEKEFGRRYKEFRKSLDKLDTKLAKITKNKKKNQPVINETFSEVKQKLNEFENFKIASLIEITKMERKRTCDFLKCMNDYLKAQLDFYENSKKQIFVFQERIEEVIHAQEKIPPEISEVFCSVSNFEHFQDYSEVKEITKIPKLPKKGMNSRNIGSVRGAPNSEISGHKTLRRKKLTAIFESHDNGGGVSVVRGLWGWDALATDELSFNPGTLMILENDDNEDWWYCSLEGKIGLVPAKFVEKL